MTVSGPGQNGTWIGGTFYPMDSDMAEAAVDMVDQGSVFNVANQTGTMGFAQGGSTPWWARIPEYLGAAGEVIRGFTGKLFVVLLVTILMASMLSLKALKKLLTIQIL